MKLMRGNFLANYFTFIKYPDIQVFSSISIIAGTYGNSCQTDPPIPIILTQ
ncbi:hypothetical protein [Aquimarina aggregata]|uniref:hypothetical protein n=1 Tax=Aquimarina aggregata TaxID=1642818 RepID=UPI00248FFBBF|nr:hypothetical protein [Aquimarina aggregata]